MARVASSAWFVLAGLLLSGCSGGASDAEEGDEGDADEGLPGLTIPWSLTDCRFGVAIVAAPGAIVSQYLPPGFRTLSLAQLANPSAPNPNGEGNVGVELFDCASGSGLAGEEIPGMVYASYFSAVEPPAALLEDADFYFVKWDVLIPDEARRTLLMSYYVPASGGEVTFSQEPELGSMAGHAGTVAWDTHGSTDTLAGTGVAEQSAGSFVEFTSTPGGLAVWRMNFTWSGGGLGPQTVMVGSGGLAAQLIGTQPKAGIGYSGVATFSGGSLVLPPQPAVVEVVEEPRKPPRADSA